MHHHITRCSSLTLYAFFLHLRLGGRAGLEPSHHFAGFFRCKGFWVAVFEGDWFGGAGDEAFDLEVFCWGED
jgi:hypothetical protein